MSFFFQTIAIPFWFIVLILASATPLWIKWYIKFHKKFITTGILRKMFGREKSPAQMKNDILKKATDHWNENSELSGFTENKTKAPKKNIDPVKKQNILTALTMLAASGERGILSKTLSDEAKINSLETTSALAYLTEKKYAEAINATTGKRYYLTDLGRRYCINKRIPLAKD